MNYRQFIYGIIIITFYGCSGYTKEDGKVYLRNSNESKIGVDYIEIDSADYNSFETISNDVNLNLAKDKDYVFKDAEILVDADPKTFVQINNYYWKDKNYVYLLRFGGTDCKIKQADAETFEAIDNNLWARDKGNVFYEFKQLIGVIPNEFKVIDDDWGKDSNYFFWHELKIDSLDYHTGEILSPYYIKDKYNVFYMNELVIGADASTFVPDGVGSFGHDHKNMFDGTKNEGPITGQYRKMYVEKTNR